MRYQIEQFYKPGQPVPVSSLNIQHIDWDFDSIVTSEDRKITEEYWEQKIIGAWERKSEATRGPKPFAPPRGTAILRNVDAACDVSEFGTMAYSFYQSVSNTSKEQPRPLSPALYEQMRLVAVGAALHTIDNMVLVHQRSPEDTHSQSRIDSSFAGASRFYVPGKIELDLTRDLYRRMDAEVPIPHEKTNLVGLTGVHSSEAPDFSGYFAFYMKTDLEAGEVREAIRAKHGGQIESAVLVTPDKRKHFFVPAKDLGEYVVRELCDTKLMVGDGAAVFLPSLPHDEFMHFAGKINEKGIDWKFGRLVNGLCV